MSELILLFLGALTFIVLLASWRVRSPARRKARHKVQYILAEWRGFDRPESPWEMLTCDRRQEAPLPDHKSSDVSKPETLRHAPTVSLCPDDFRPKSNEPPHPNLF